MKLSVLIPVFNEAATLAQVVDRLRRLPPPLELELIAIDDASTDDSGAILDELGRAGRLDHVVRHPKNRGKGAAIRSGLARVTGDVVVVQDADLEYDPGELPALLDPIADGRADAVFGSRFRGGPHRALFFWHALGNRFLTFLSNLFTDLNLTDLETCYKVVRTDLLKRLPLTADRFGFEVEVTARLAQVGARIWEMPISYSGRTYAEGKKITWRDGLAALFHIVRFNVLPPRGDWRGSRKGSDR